MAQMTIAYYVMISGIVILLCFNYTSSNQSGYGKYKEQLRGSSNLSSLGTNRGRATYVAPMIN